MKKPTARNKIYYLASPYSSGIKSHGIAPELVELVTKQIIQARYEKTEEAAHLLTSQGYILYEPIACSHNKARLFHTPQNYEHWKKRDRYMVSRSDGVIVVTIAGYMDSIGVKDEVSYARKLGKPVYFFNPYNNTFCEGVL